MLVMNINDINTIKILNLSIDLIFHVGSAGIVFRRQDLTSTDVKL